MVASTTMKITGVALFHGEPRFQCTDPAYRGVVLRGFWPHLHNEPRVPDLESEIELTASFAQGPLVVRTPDLLARLFARADALRVRIERALVLGQDDAPDVEASWLAGAPSALPCLGWDWVFPELQFSFVAFGAPTTPRNEHGLFDTREELAEHEAIYRRRFEAEGLGRWESPDGMYAVRLFEDAEARWLRGLLAGPRGG
jgi:hypothetical protein